MTNSPVNRQASFIKQAAKGNSVYNKREQAHNSKWTVTGAGALEHGGKFTLASAYARVTANWQVNHPW
jgi:hypothetical protein